MAQLFFGKETLKLFSFKNREMRTGRDEVSHSWKSLLDGDGDVPEDEGLDEDQVADDVPSDSSSLLRVALDVDRHCQGRPDRSSATMDEATHVSIHPMFPQMLCHRPKTAVT